MNVKSIFSEIHSGYIAIISKFSLMGIIYCCFHKFGTNINNNIRGLDLLDIENANIGLNNGKKLTIDYGITNRVTILLNRIYSLYLVYF